MRLAALALSVALFGFGAEPGSKVSEFVLRTVGGVEVASAGLRGAKVTVVGFVSTKCPVSAAYNQRMRELYQQFSARGVGFVFIDSNANETEADMQLYTKQAGLEFPLYRDVGNRVADLFGAQSTPEIFVLDGDSTLRYRGAIDDSQNEARVKVRGLRLAIEAVLGGKPVQPERTKAFGCTLHRVRT